MNEPSFCPGRITVPGVTEASVSTPLKGAAKLYFAKTNSPGLEGKDHSFQFSSNYNWNGWRLIGAYTEVGENFNPEVGFLGREGGFKKVEGLIFYNMRAKETSRFLENRPHISYRGYWDAENRQQTGFLHIAHKANVPVFLVAFDYKKKLIEFGPMHNISDNTQHELNRIYRHFENVPGKYPDKMITKVIPPVEKEIEQ